MKEHKVTTEAEVLPDGRFAVKEAVVMEVTQNTENIFTEKEIEKQIADLEAQLAQAKRFREAVQRAKQKAPEVKEDGVEPPK